MIPVNSSPTGYEVLKANGATSNSSIVWLGPWTNQAQIDGHLSFCKQRGIIPAFHLYWWGDSISATAILNGRTSDGSKTEAGWWALSKLLGERVKVSGAPEVWVVMETEFNKKALTDDAAACAKFDKSVRDMQWTIKGIAPAVKIVSAPGSWSAPSSLYAKFPEMTKSIDIYGTQFMRSITREGKDKYDRTDEDAIAYFEELETLFPGKPKMVTDLALATYGGYSPSYPYPGGSSTVVEEARQASVLQSFVTAKTRLEQLNVRAIFYREPKDNTSRNPNTNYYGYAEHYFGVIRIDGAKKPGFQTFIDLATDAPQTVPKEEFDALQTKFNALQMQVETLQSDFDTLKRANDSNLALLEGLKAEIAALQAKLEAARRALA